MVIPDYKDKNFEQIIRKIYEEDYVKNHMGCQKISEKYGKYNGFFNRWFNYFNLPIRSDRDKSLKYTCNSDFFEIIDTEEKAYWLGFIYADGFISSSGKHRNKRIGISLAVKDIGHLEKFKKSINGTMPINTYKVSSGYNTNSIYCIILVTDSKLADDLIDKGCYEHKSNIIKFPTKNQLPNNLIRHFIRGYFDGDGSIYYTNKKEDHIPQFSINILGTDDLLEGIANNLIENNILNSIPKFYKRKDGQIVSNFKFGGNRKVEKFCHYIYDNATILLDRKHEKFHELLEYNKLVDNSRIDKICFVCGDIDSYEYNRWTHGGEYNNKILCGRHYRQLLKYGEIRNIEKPEIPKSHCDICNDNIGKMILCGDKYPKYKSLTLCRKHYNQVREYGEVKDDIPAKHKEILNEI